ncbi:putative cupredoxin, multicopper oxidase, type 2 [Helianthus anomalus]
MKQARTIRWNLTANAARPNPQGSYHYGTIPVTRTVVLANSEANINGKLRYAVNQVSYVNPKTPLKIADFYNISGVFYNLNDATTRHTVQVYPKSWSAILVSLDNKGMWNLMSTIWPRRYLGQELYVRVWNDEKSFHTEYDIPENALRCGLAPLK